MLFFFFKQKTAYEMRISDWSSDVCSSDLSHLITEAEGTRGVVMKIDDRPAVDVLREDVGELLARDLRRIGGYIFAGLPIPGSDTGDYLVRDRKSTRLNSSH